MTNPNQKQQAPGKNPQQIQESPGVRQDQPRQPQASSPDFNRPTGTPDKQHDPSRRQGRDDSAFKPSQK